jgi:hypothetical protein
VAGGMGVGEMRRLRMGIKIESCWLELAVGIS